MASIFKRANTYYISYYVNGKRKKKAIGKSKKVAEIAVKDIEVKIAKNEIGIVEKDNDIKKFINEYLEYSASNKAKETFRRDNTILNTIFLSYIKVNKLSKLTPQMLEKYKVKRLESVKKNNCQPGFDYD